MSKQWWVMVACAAVGAGIGVVVAEWIVPAYWIKDIIIGAGAWIGVIVGTQFGQK